MYMRKKDYSAAEDLLIIATQIDPTYADGYIRLGLVYEQQELYSEASEQFKLATEYGAQNFDAWFRLASSLNQQSEWDKSANAA